MPSTSDLEWADARTLERRNQRLLLVGLACYGLLFSILMLSGGGALTPDVVVVMGALGVVLLISSRPRLSAWLPLVVLLLAYELMRGLADDAGFPLHLEDMIVAEQLLALGAIPTQVLQENLHVGAGLDPVAAIATGVYMLHFLVPIATGVLLWLRRRSMFHDFMAALIVLSLAAFVTYLLLPAAPPWYAAKAGLLGAPDGLPAVVYLKPVVFESVAGSLGFDGSLLYTSVFYGLGPNDVAAWPSLHVAYPFLMFLVLRRAFGPVAWLALGYTLLVAFSVVYTADHWVHDCIAGLAYAYIAYYVIVHTPGSLRERLDRFVTGRSRPLLGATR